MLKIVWCGNLRFWSLISSVVNVNLATEFGGVIYLENYTLPNWNEISVARLDDFLMMWQQIY